MYGKQYPIWNKVTSCIYSGEKSFGAKDTSKIEVLVGSSKNNCIHHCKIVTTNRIINHPKYGECIAFKTSLDDVVLKETLFTINKKGKAEKMIKQRTKLNQIKSL